MKKVVTMILANFVTNWLVLFFCPVVEIKNKNQSWWSGSNICKLS